MGTTWTVRLVLGDPARGTGLKGLIEKTLAEQVSIFSHWDPDSELSRFNASAPGRIVVSKQLWTVVEAAVDLAHQTGGGMDPTLGALVDLWGFGPPGLRAADRQVPDADEIAAAQAFTGWQRLAPDPGARSLVQPGGLRLDLSGIAKGHAVDRVSDLLRAVGVGHHLVEIGGELKGCGVKPDGMPWWVEIDCPHRLRAPRTLVALHDLALASSGDTERAFEVAGRRYGHTIDGRTGRPVINGATSVSVIADSAMQADGLATALTVLGGEAGLAWADAHGVAALIQIKTARGFEEVLTRGARAMLDEAA